MYKPIIYIAQYLLDSPKTKKVAESICLALNELGVVYETLKFDTENYWCRDYMPLMISNDGTYATYKYHPDYLVNYKIYNNKKHLVNQDIACKGINISEPTNMDIVLDGGNYVRCGNKVIMTDKIFSENPTWSANKLVKHLSDSLNAEIILLPWDMREFCGHSDGIVAPLDDERILLNSCGWGKNKRYYERLLKILKGHFKDNVIELYYDCEEDKYSWCYINFLRVPNGILLPCLSVNHDCENDKVALKKFKELFPNLKVMPIYAEPLIKEGGALHCVTWEYMEKTK